MTIIMASAFRCLFSRSKIQNSIFYTKNSIFSTPKRKKSVCNPNTNRFQFPCRSGCRRARALQPNASWKSHSFNSEPFEKRKLIVQNLATGTRSLESTRSSSSDSELGDFELGEACAVVSRPMKSRKSFIFELFTFWLFYGVNLFGF